jgi:hypothetical protein
VSKKFLINVIIVLIVIFIVYFTVQLISGLFGINITTMGGPGMFDEKNSFTGFPVKDLQIMTMRPETQKTSDGRSQLVCVLTIKNNNPSLTATNVTTYVTERYRGEVYKKDMISYITRQNHILPGQTYEYIEYPIFTTSTPCDISTRVKDAGVTK